VRPDIDANLSPMVTALLRDAGNYASHVADHGLLSATDEAIFEWADRNAAVVVTADSDFAMLQRPAQCRGRWRSWATASTSRTPSITSKTIW